MKWIIPPAPIGAKFSGSYLDMIKEIPFQYDLDNPVLELKFQSELSKIVKHYDSLTFSEEAEAVKILMGKIIRIRFSMNLFLFNSSLE